jgi:pimeloyl-ACP methyl ester carboxylesterase
VPAGRSGSADPRVEPQRRAGGRCCCTGWVRRGVLVAARVELADRGYLVVAPDLRSHGTQPDRSRPPLGRCRGRRALGTAGTSSSATRSAGRSPPSCWLERPRGRRAVLIDPVLTLPDEAREEVRASSGPRSDGSTRRGPAAHPGGTAADVERKVLAAGGDPRRRRSGPRRTTPWDVVPLGRLWRCRVHLVAADPTLGALLSPTELTRPCRRRNAGDERDRPGAGHSVHRDDPAAVLAAIDRLLETT